MTDRKAEALERALTDGRKQADSVMRCRPGGAQQGTAGGAPYFNAARTMAREMGWPAEELIRRVVAFHRERLAAVPDLTVYPELRSERDRLDARLRGMREGGMSDELIALVVSLDFWRDYRLPVEEGKTCYRIATQRKQGERCRIVYMPDSDVGPLHAKNVDDPVATFVPQAPQTNPGPWPFFPLFFDGVGSGLHVDEIPPEIFPVNALALCAELCSTVEAAAEFLVRYNYFWGGGNLLVHDEHGNSRSFDKSSRTRITVHKPDSGSGINYCNAMGAIDPAYQAFIEAQRNKYLADIGAGQDFPDVAYWNLYKGRFRNMKRYMGELAKTPTRAKLIAVMESRDPDGPLCNWPVSCHPGINVLEATLQFRLYHLREYKLFQKQWRGDVPVWEDAWEEVQYDAPAEK